MKKRLTNHGYEVIFRLLTIIVYIIPLAILAITQKDKLFKDGKTSITAFSLLLIIFALFFCKKAVHKLCKLFSPMFFGSVIALVISLGIRSFTSDLVLVSLVSAVGSAAAWLPYQLSLIYSRNAYDDKGNPVKEPGMSVKEALSKFFSFWV